MATEKPTDMSFLKGPVTLSNYDKRVEFYGTKIKKWEESWPFLSHDPQKPGTADQLAWEQYFRERLGGYPASYKLFRERRMMFYNVPEASPPLFDSGYVPGPELPALPRQRLAREPEEDRRRITERILREYRHAKQTGVGQFPNVFVPVSAPQYQAMVDRAEAGEPFARWHYGISEENLGRSGIWVPLAWLRGDDNRPKSRRHETAEAFMARHGITQTQWDAIPDAPTTWKRPMEGGQR